jgi:hypothetical protein
MNGRCRAKTKAGKACRALATKNGLCALHADPARASALGYRSGKARQYVVNQGDGTTLLPAPQTAQDVRKALGQVMADLTARKLDPRVASALAYIGNVMLKAIEVADFEERMSKLESTLRAPNAPGS